MPRITTTGRIQPQHEFLAEDVWGASAYGRNMIYDHGHHGNAILSRFPILHAHNQDVTHLQFEKRGLLHCQIKLPEGPAAHCVCAHLSLFGYSRRKQMDALADYLDTTGRPDGPADHRRRFQRLAQPGRRTCWPVASACARYSAARAALPARSFPAAMPMFRLDRIYVRGFEIKRTEVHHGQPWSAISDHAALSAHPDAAWPLNSCRATG